MPSVLMRPRTNAPTIHLWRLGKRSSRSVWHAPAQGEMRQLTRMPSKVAALTGQPDEITFGADAHVHAKETRWSPVRKGQQGEPWTHARLEERAERADPPAGRQRRGARGRWSHATPARAPTESAPRRREGSHRPITSSARGVQAAVR